MAIKSIITRWAEKLTGRKCSKCDHNCGGRCCHPDGNMFLRCWNSITRPGFTHTQETQPAPMTPEEEYQLQKIRETLAEAEDTARDGGLLEG